MLVLIFHPAQAFVIHSDKTDHMRGKFLIGIKSAALLSEKDSRQLQTSHPFRHFARHFAGDPEKRFALHARSQIAPVDGKNRRYGSQFAGRILHFLGNGVYGIDIDADCKLAAFAIQNRTAFGIQRNNALALFVGARNIVIVLKNLHVKKTKDYNGKPHE